jgi:hypothetical protein
MLAFLGCGFWVVGRIGFDPAQQKVNTSLQR